MFKLFDESGGLVKTFYRILREFTVNMKDFNELVQSLEIYL